MAAAAFFAHGLKAMTDADGLRLWAIGASLQLVTAPAVLVLSREGISGGRISGFLLTAGVALFSGTLYLMALGAPRILGAVTPVGGLLLMLGWMGLVFPSKESGGEPSKDPASRKGSQ